MLLSFSGCKCRDFFGLSKFSETFFCDFHAFFPLSRCMPRRTIRRNAMIINPKAPSRYILRKTCRPIANKAPRLQKIRRTLSYRDPKTDRTEGLNPRKAMRKFPGSPRIYMKDALRYSGTETKNPPENRESDKAQKIGPHPRYEAIVPARGDVSSRIGKPEYHGEAADRQDNLTQKLYIKRYGSVLRSVP